MRGLKKTDKTSLFFQLNVISSIMVHTIFVPSYCDFYWQEKHPPFLTFCQSAHVYMNILYKHMNDKV